MIINPFDVINLLLATFQSIYLSDTPIIREEVEIKEVFGKMLLNCSFQYHALKAAEHSSLDFEEPVNEYEAEEIEDDNSKWTDDEPVEICLGHDKDIELEYKRKAVAFWKIGVRKYSELSTVQHDFKLALSERQLRRWAIQIETGEPAYLGKKSTGKFT